MTDEQVDTLLDGIKNFIEADGENRKHELSRIEQKLDELAQILRSINTRLAK